MELEFTYIFSLLLSAPSLCTFHIYIFASLYIFPLPGTSRSTSTRSVSPPQGAPQGAPHHPALTPVIQVYGSMWTSRGKPPPHYFGKYVLWICVNIHMRLIIGLWVDVDLRWTAFFRYGYGITEYIEYCWLNIGTFFHTVIWERHTEYGMGLLGPSPH